MRLKLIRVSLVLCLSVFLNHSVIAQEGIIIPLGSGAKVLHIPIGKSYVEAFPAFEDYYIMLSDVCDAMSLEDDDCLIYPFNADIDGNAFASIYDDNKIIVYDRVMSSTIGYLGAMAVIAHEVGHHYCNHLYENEGAVSELEADRFAGAAMRNSGFDLRAALQMAVLFDERPSNSYPERGDREMAIEYGWSYPEFAKDCQ